MRGYNFLPEPNSRRPDFLPLLILLVIIGLIGIVIWLFPYAQGYVQRQNCIAAGQVNCG
jgi:hypothetical protein